MAKTYSIKNITRDDFSVSGLHWNPGETKTVKRSQLTDEIIALTDAGTKLYCAEDLSPLGGAATLANTMATAITYNGGGTPVARVGTTLTIPAITADASAQNAFATLFVELALARTMITAMAAQIESLKKSELG